MATSNEQYENLAMIIEESLEPELLVDKQLLQNSIEEIQIADARSDSVVEQIRARLDGTRANIVLEAKSIKLPNLRFNLAQFFLETVGLVVSFNLARPVATALTAIRFIQKVRGLSTIEINQKDAQVLLAIYSLTREENLITVDKLNEAIRPELGITEAERPFILERLKKLGSITLAMSEIQLNESIIFYSEK